jgi:hypothetical protein
MGTDSLGWALSKSKKFDVRSFCWVLKGVLLVEFPWRSICKVKVPAMVVFSVWIVAHNILIVDNFRKTKMIIID